MYNTYLDKLHGQFLGEVPMEALPKNHAGINFGKLRVTWDTTEMILQQSDTACAGDASRRLLHLTIYVRMRLEASIMYNRLTPPPGLDGHDRIVCEFILGLVG